MSFDRPTDEPDGRHPWQSGQSAAGGEVVQMGEIPRAERFPIHLPVRYRQVGQDRWLEGTIENISGTGVLFHAEQSIESETAIELSFILSRDAAEDAASEVVCTGRIVRRAAQADVNGRATLAATILNYRFLRRQGDMDGV